MISKILTWFFLTLLFWIGAEIKVYADYKAQCLGADGKFRRCYVHVNQGNLVIRYKAPGPTMQIAGKQIFRIVYEQSPARADTDPDPIFLSSLYKDHFSAAFVPYYDTIGENGVLGIQFSDSQGTRGALLMRLHEEQARGLQVQLEGISRSQAVPLK